MADARRERDPVGAYNFEVDGISTGIFRNVEGLSFEVEMIEYRVSENPMLPRFRPGLPKHGRITLKRGYILGTDLNEWIRDVQRGTYERKDASIVLHDNTSTEVARWNLLRCLPTKWSISGLDGKSNDVVVEQLELVVEEIESVSVSGSSSGDGGFWSSVGSAVGGAIGGSTGAAMGGAAGGALDAAGGIDGDSGTIL